MKAARKYLLVDPNTPLQSTSTTSEAERILYDPKLAEDLKAKLYEQLLAKNSLLSAAGRQSPPPPPVVVRDFEGDVLESVPYGQRYKAKRILRELENNSDVSVGANGEFVYKNVLVPKSNIIDLVVEALLKKKRLTGYETPGWYDFANSLQNIDTSYITNGDIKRVIRESLKRSTPVKRTLGEDSLIDSQTPVSVSAIKRWSPSKKSSSKKLRRSSRNRVKNIDWHDIS